MNREYIDPHNLHIANKIMERDGIIPPPPPPGPGPRQISSSPQPAAIKLPIAESVAELEKRLHEKETDCMILTTELARAKKRINQLNIRLLEGCK